MPAPPSLINPIGSGKDPYETRPRSGYKPYGSPPSATISPASPTGISPEATPSPILSPTPATSKGAPKSATTRPPRQADTNSTASGPRSGGIPRGVLEGLIVGTVSAVIIIIVLIGVAILVFFWTWKRRNKAHRLDLPGGTKDGPSRGTFTYEVLSNATDNFSSDNLLGQGGFGYVYKGVLSDGRMVAVKQHKAESRQGEREFQAEIETISRIHHRHLVSLVGYCINEAQRLLVYEFVPNNTLEFHLHGKGRPTMNWATRMKISIGSAKGLAYLHEDCFPKIIHRDIKAANILLDFSFEAKVADFGLAKYFSETDTHVSTRVMGTFGYMDPEYASSGKLTEKSDVFSFGVVLLELITGHQPVDRTLSSDYACIVDWARPLLQQALHSGNYDALVDTKLQKDYNTGEMARVVACASACVNHSARHRPQMSQVVRALEGNMSLDDLNKGNAPGYGRKYISYDSLDNSCGRYKEDLAKFRKLAPESQEQGSSEYNAFTSDYAGNPSSSSTEGQQTTQETEKSVKDSKEGQKTMQEGEFMKAPES